MGERLTVGDAVSELARSGQTKGARWNLQMSGDPHYQPKQLLEYLGYDQRVLWQIIAEWFWMLALAAEGLMPPEHAALLTRELLQTLFANITTTKVTKLEHEKTRHDILALLELMRRILPKELHRWLHLGLTSYDTICTAYALQARHTFTGLVYPQLLQVDALWRERIEAYAETLQIGRTHLQDALPITVGAWLAVLHSRFVNVSRRALSLSQEVPGKFSGAVGTGGALRVLGGRRNLEETALRMLGLPEAMLCTQIVQPEGLERFYNEFLLLSAVLANFGDDVRHLQSSAIGEVTSASSTSSTMSHKTANPVVAEQLDGMHISVRAAFLDVTETLNSTLQRDLRNSNVMRSYTKMFVYVFQQLLTAERVLKSFAVDAERCRANFDRNGMLVVAELLHLSLQEAGFPQAHKFVNQTIVPKARASGDNLLVEMDRYARRSRSVRLREAWASVSEEVRVVLANPETYLGNAVAIAKAEAENALLPL